MFPPTIDNVSDEPIVLTGSQPSYGMVFITNNENLVTRKALFSSANALMLTAIGVLF
jgi:hypothetical protein